MPQIYQDLNDLWQNSVSNKSNLCCQNAFALVGVFKDHLIKHIAFLYGGNLNQIAMFPE